MKTTANGKKKEKIKKGGKGIHPYTHFPKAPDTSNSKPKIIRKIDASATIVKPPITGFIVTIKPAIMPSIPTMIEPGVPREALAIPANSSPRPSRKTTVNIPTTILSIIICLLYTSDAADEEDSVDLGGRRIIKKKKKKKKNK